ncbi:MAG: hypothetical protein ACLFN4_07865 [Candidatus Acetothermia bacterium]
MAGIEKATFGKSIVAAIASGFTIWLLSLILPVLGTVVGLVFAIFIIKGIYETGFAKALLAWISCVLAQILAVAIGSATFAGALL